MPFVYFGTPWVARDTLGILAERGFVPALVVTNPDRPRGRGLALAPSETKAWALDHAIPVLAPERLDAETIGTIASYSAAYGICVAYGKIIPEPLIAAFPKGILNIHYSLLPKYRGASPVEAALLHGDEVTGVTIQQMAHALDAGDVLASREIAIEPHETARELRPRLVRIGAELLADTLPDFLAGRITPMAQDHTHATYAKKIAKADGELDLAGDPLVNWRTYRAYAEWPGTYFFAERGDRRIRVKIVTARFENGAFTPLRVIPEGKKEMAYEDFIRNNKS